LVSDNWSKVFKWRWNGVMPEEARQRLGKIVTKAHAQGRKVRFWATPDKPEVWTALFDAGVDLINTDDLEGLQKFLLSRSQK
jgi:glycerophosphoryl diester phosphodiesterase